MVTALARIEGRAVGVIANNPLHLAGADRRTVLGQGGPLPAVVRRLRLPVLSLCDTPGFMVGPAAEETASSATPLACSSSAATLTVPFFTVILRKGYGLGAKAMAGGTSTRPLFTRAWPTGEFGGMGLEGAVRLAIRKELEAIADDEEREAAYEALVGGPTSVEGLHAGTSRSTT